MDALSASAKVDLPELPALLKRYLEKSEETAYRKSFPWIDQVREIRDATLVDRLDSVLVERIDRKDLARIWLAVPEMIEWADVEGFVYRPKSSDMVYGDLDLKDYLDESDDAVVDVAFLRRARVFQINSADGSSVKKWAVYQCLYAEVSDGGKEFVLSNSRWYEIDADYVRAVDSGVASIPDFAGALPDYKDVDEKTYNARLATENSTSFFLMDRELVRHGGARSSFEFCDIVTDKRQLLHVKNYGGSAVLSHLFAQGLNSAKLFLRDASFRSKLQDKLPHQIRAHFPKTRPDPTQYEIVYAIVSDSNSPIKQSLPFFSRMNLHAASTELAMFGFRISIAKIRDRTVGAQTGP